MSLIADYAQTRDIKNHQGFYETNPLLGRNPSDSRIRNYFISSALIHTGIAYNMKPAMRKDFQYATIALQVAVILHNKKIGLRYEF
jgi:hypothetical protein